MTDYLSVPSYEVALPAPRRRTPTGWTRWSDGQWVPCASPFAGLPKTPREPAVVYQARVKDQLAPCPNQHVGHWTLNTLGHRVCRRCRADAMRTRRAERRVA